MAARRPSKSIASLAQPSPISEIARNPRLISNQPSISKGFSNRLRRPIARSVKRIPSSERRWRLAFMPVHFPHPSADRVTDARRPPSWVRARSVCYHVKSGVLTVGKLTGYQTTGRISLPVSGHPSSDLSRLIPAPAECASLTRIRKPARI